MKRDTKVTLVTALTTGAITVIATAFGIWNRKVGLEEGYEIGHKDGVLEGCEYGCNSVNEARDEQEKVLNESES